jgi:hypothetical protein
MHNCLGSATKHWPGRRAEHERRQDAEQSVGEILQRHGAGDWAPTKGIVSRRPAALEPGLRSLSIYRTCRDTELVVHH